ncbi:MAG: poly-beta-1,6 N-acetyl-D-glucosamine export porin PgaA [bacterium]|nr:poly-beta-1,6 N-acetyl-D-glucosamine export porin PgaA [bacterium]
MNKIGWVVLMFGLGSVCFPGNANPAAITGPESRSLSKLPVPDEIDVEQRYQQALALASTGGAGLEQALVLFETLVAVYQDRREIFHDYIVVLTWAGKNSQALKFLPELNLEEAPAYVLEALGKAAQNTLDFARALRLYQIAVRRFPERLSAAVGLGLIMADKKDFQQAIKNLEALRKRYPGKSEIAAALRYVYIQLAREGGEYLERAVRSLKRLAGAYPSEKGIFHDYLVTLTWAGVYELPLTLSRRLNAEKTPAYVLETLGKAARETGRFEKAKDFYRILIRRFPKRLSGPLGLAENQADNGEIEAALTTLTPFRAQVDPAVLPTLIYVYLKLARLGGTHLNRAVSLFEELHVLYSEEKKVLYDYIVVLTWAGQDARALNLLSRIDLNKAPGYVLETVTKAAHRLKRHDLAIPIYQAAAKRFPEQLPILAGLAQKTADEGDTDTALAMLEILRKSHPDNIELLFASGHVYRLRGNYAEAMLAYLRLRELKPDNKDMRYLFILTAMELGAIEIAMEEAKERPELLDEKEWNRLLDRWTAQAIRWGRFAPRTELERFKELDQALQILDEAIQQVGATDWNNTDIPNYLRFNRISALSDRRLIKKVIAEYKRLPPGVELPCYVLIAVGNAYHVLRYPPPQVRDIYLKAVQKCAQHTEEIFEAELGLNMAYVENNEWEKAFEGIDRLAEESPVWLYSKNPNLVEANKQKLKAAMRAAMVRAYADMLDDAQLRLEIMLVTAPNNVDLHQSLATIYHWRGWDERARNEFDMVLAAEPDQLYARIMRTHVLMRLAAYPEAEKEIRELAALYSEEPDVRKLQYNWAVHKRAELVVDSGWRSDGVGFAGEEWYLDSTFYSRLLDYRYRLFLRSYYSHAGFPEGRDSYERAGVGLDYAIPGLKLGMELSQQRFSGEDLGIRAWGTWRKDDHHSLTAQLDSFSTEVPLRAYFQGVSAQSLELSFLHRSHERRHANFSLKMMRFSDNNHRYEISGRFFQNLIVRPRYKLNVQLHAHLEANDIPAWLTTYYFNPKRDVSLEAQIDNFWQLFRRYTYNFWHYLRFSAGDHWQQDFGHAFIGGIRYGHEWRLGESLSLFYAFEYFRRSYDGEVEYTKLFDMALQWRF